MNPFHFITMQAAQDALRDLGVQPLHSAAIVGRPKRRGVRSKLAARFLAVLVVVSALLVVSAPVNAIGSLNAGKGGGGRKLVLTLVVVDTPKSTKFPDSYWSEVVTKASSFWSRTSQGKVTIELRRIIVFPSKSRLCTKLDVSEPRSVARSLRVNPVGNQRFFLVNPVAAEKGPNDAEMWQYTCGLTFGIAETPGRFGWIAATGDAEVDAETLAHELGHTMGLGHTATGFTKSGEDCAVFDSTCELVDVDDYGGDDVMGGGSQWTGSSGGDALNPIMMRSLNLLPATGVLTVRLEQNLSRRLDMVPITDLKGVRAIKLVDGKKEYWLSYTNSLTATPVIKVHSVRGRDVIQHDPYPTLGVHGLMANTTYPLSKGILTVLSLGDVATLQLAPSIELVAELADHKTIRVSVSQATLLQPGLWRAATTCTSLDGKSTISGPSAELTASATSALLSFGESVLCSVRVINVQGSDERIVGVSRILNREIDPALIPTFSVTDDNEDSFELRWREDGNLLTAKGDRVTFDYLGNFQCRKGPKQKVDRGSASWQLNKKWWSEEPWWHAKLIIWKSDGLTDFESGSVWLLATDEAGRTFQLRAYSWGPYSC